MTTTLCAISVPYGMHQALAAKAASNCESSISYLPMQSDSRVVELTFIFITAVLYYKTGQLTGSKYLLLRSAYRYVDMYI